MDKRDCFNVRQPLYLLVYSTRNIIGWKAAFVFVSNVIFTSLIYLLYVKGLGYNKQIISIMAVLWVTIAFIIGWKATRKAMHNLLYSKRFCKKLADIMPDDLRRMMLKANKYQCPVLVNKYSDADMWATYMIKLNMLTRVQVQSATQAAYNFNAGLKPTELQYLLQCIEQYYTSRNLDAYDFKSTMTQYSKYYPNDMH